MKMRKILIAGLAAAMTMAMSITSFAAGWQQNATGWWYDNGNGTWPANTWQWIDGNNDGVAECYYFDASGYMLANTTTPDGYTVDVSGAWVNGGVVQKQNVNPNQETVQVADASDNAWSFGGSTNNENNISSTGTAGTGYNGIKLLTDEEAYEKILEVKKEHPEGERTAQGACTQMVYWVIEKMYGRGSLTLQYKDFDWDDLHVGDAIAYTSEETPGHYVIVMEICDDYIKVAEADYGRTVHYGRKITRDNLENDYWDVSIYSAWQ